MNIVGYWVLHQTFGAGEIKSLEGRTLRAVFDGGSEKSFVYPDAFERLLVLDDPGIQTRLCEELGNLRKREREVREAKRQEDERLLEERRKQQLELTGTRRKTAKVSAAGQAKSKAS